MSIATLESAAVTALRSVYANAVAEVEFLEDLAARRLKALGILGADAAKITTTAATDTTTTDAPVVDTPPGVDTTATATTEAPAADPQPAAAATASSAG
ncbi:hypothetical protein FGG78_20980 [Thioclava sp. BHET1]|nr:hypothetical protein FGG78_20980 [Thioclava sp. BHET1]